MSYQRVNKHGNNTLKWAKLPVDMTVSADKCSPASDYPRIRDPARSLHS